MATSSAKLRYLRIAPRKARLVANVIKGLAVGEAEAQLMFNAKRASDPVLKLLRSAVANAKNKQLNAEKMVVKEIRVDGGPMIKRWLPRAQGRATPLQKKSSHITLIIEESEKISVPRFKIEKEKRIRKSQAEKMKKEKTEDKHEHAHEHIHEYEHEHHDHGHGTESEKTSQKKSSITKGFAQRIFRRKSV